MTQTRNISGQNLTVSNLLDKAKSFVASLLQPASRPAFAFA